MARQALEIYSSVVVVVAVSLRERVKSCQVFFIPFKGNM